MLRRKISDCSLRVLFEKKGGEGIGYNHKILSGKLFKIGYNLKNWIKIYLGIGYNHKKWIKS